MRWFRRKRQLEIVDEPVELTSYEVVINGETVWADETIGYQGIAHFPREYSDRPPSGIQVYLYVGGELIGIQRSLEDEEALMKLHEKGS